MTNPDVEIVVTPPPQITIEVDVNGPPGPRGPKGDKGDKGDPGGAGASTSWTPSAVYELGIAGGYGLVAQPDSDLDHELGIYESIGIRWLRFDFDWSAIEKVRGVFDWSVQDRVVAAAQAHGMQVLGILGYSPDWAATIPGEDKSPPTDMAFFADFCAAAATHFPQVEAWEIWNEANHVPFWEPSPDPVVYTEMVKAAYPVLKAIAPNATVVAGSLSPAVTTPGGSIAPADFTIGCYAAGIQGYFDAWSVHPYCYPALPTDATTIAWNTFQRLPLVRAAMVAGGDSDKKIWLTEYGAPTGTDPTAVSEPLQAAIFTEALIQAQNWDWTGPLMLFSGRDRGTDQSDREQMFGFIRDDWSSKVAANSLIAALRDGLPASEGSPKKLFVSNEQQTERYVVFQTDGENRWAVGANPNLEDPLIPGSGSAFAIARYDDDGAFVDNPLDVSRESGTVSMSNVWMRDGSISAINHLYISNDIRPVIDGTVDPVLSALLVALETIGLIVDNTTIDTGGGGGLTGPFMTWTVEGLAEDYKAFRMKSADVTRFEWGLARDSEGGDLSLRRHDKLTGAYIDSPIYVDSGDGSVYTHQLGITAVDNTKIVLNVVAASNNPTNSLFRVALPNGTEHLSVGWDGTLTSNWGVTRFAAVKLGCAQFVREGASAGNTILAGYTSVADANADTAVFQVRGSGAVQIGAAENDNDAVRKDQIKAIAAASTSFADFQTRMAAW